MASIHEQLSQQFAQWEKRGRGWDVWPAPVFPEPPFRPFSYSLAAAPDIDDGRKPTLLSSLFQGLSKAFSTAPAQQPPAIPQPEEEPEILERDELVLIELQVSLPAKFAAKPQAFAQVLNQLSFCQEPVSFEIIATAERIITQFAAHPNDVAILRRQLKANHPEAVIIESTNVLPKIWSANVELEEAIVEFGLHEEFFSPLASVNHDPFVALIGAMADLGPEEVAVFQVLFQPVANDWAESINRTVTDPLGKPFFVNAPELTQNAEQKTSSPLFAAVVRIATQAENFDRALIIARDLTSTLRVFGQLDGNELIPLENTDYPHNDHWFDVALRQCRRSGMILNLEELLGFVHLPSADVCEPKLMREAGRTKAAPNCPEGLLLGTNTHGSQTIDVRLTPEQRVEHMHVIGVQGSGKSSLLFNMIRQDIENGQGVALLDPHGDLIEQVLTIIPPNRINDVVLIDPADETHSVGFNILSAHTDLEKRLLASDLIAVFKRTSTSWGDQMNSVLQNAIMAFLDSSQGGTLVELRRFLLEPAFRNQFLDTVGNANVLYYWKKGFSQLTGNKSIGPVMTRLDAFLEPKPISHIVCQRENRLDFSKIMDEGKIFLAKLSEGEIGDMNSYLFGSLFVAKFQATAMSRQSQTATTRRPFWLYIDEFHNFISPSMSKILAGARKYRLGLVLAHQELHQLNRDPEVASAVLSNPQTRVCFRLGDDDSKKLADGFSFFEARDLRNLDKGQAICRIQRSDCDFNLTVPLPEKVDPDVASHRREEVIQASREKYSMPREIVEAELLRSMGLAEKEPPKEQEAPTAKKSANSQKPEASAASQAPSPKTEIPKPQQPTSADIQAPSAVFQKTEPLPQPAPPPVQSPHEQTPIPETKPKEGRGGEQHTAIQRRIKDAALASGFGAETEKQTPGKRIVDLVVKNAHRSIACEIGVRTTIDREFGQVASHLKDGFSEVALVSSSPARLKQIEEAVKGGMEAEQSARVGYYSPEDFITRIKKLAVEDAQKTLPTEGKAVASKKVTRGWGVKVHKSTLPEEKIAQQDSVQFTVLASVLNSGKKKK